MLGLMWCHFPGLPCSHCCRAMQHLSTSNVQRQMAWCYPVNTLQGWISEEEVSNWLSKYDWDKSGDISFAEFAALVS